MDVSLFMWSTPIVPKDLVDRLLEALILTDAKIKEAYNKSGPSVKSPRQRRLRKQLIHFINFHDVEEAFPQHQAATTVVGAMR